MIQYIRNVGWDTTLVDLETDEKSLVVRALKTTAGAPAATAGKFEPSAFVQNIADGSIWQNKGTTASPNWYLI